MLRASQNEEALCPVGPRRRYINSLSGHYKFPIFVDDIAVDDVSFHIRLQAAAACLVRAQGVGFLFGPSAMRRTRCLLHARDPDLDSVVPLKAQNLPVVPPLPYGVNNSSIGTSPVKPVTKDEVNRCSRGAKQ